MEPAQGHEWEAVMTSGASDVRQVGTLRIYSYFMGLVVCNSCVFQILATKINFSFFFFRPD